MRLKQSLVAASVCWIVACDRSVEPSTFSAGQGDLPAGFVTSQPAQARTLVPQAELKPIISVGDPIPGQESNPDPEQRVWDPIPDGLGAYQDGNDLVLFVNHEIASGGVDTRFQYSRVSRLILDPGTLSIESGTYPITGKAEGFLFQRLCSATLLDQTEGFGSGWFFTGEESASSSSGGMQLAVSADGNQTRQLPWLGRFAHENYIAVPGFSGKTVLIGTDDTSPAGFGAPLASELYMYVADNAAGVLNGSGKLYVFTSSAVLNAGYLQTGHPISGSFVEVTDPASLTPSALQTRVDDLHAFKFVRLEDVDYDRGPPGRSAKPAIYFVDTGNNNGLCGSAPCDPYGSIYRMDLDPSDPTQGARLILLERSAGVGAGWASPDNISVSQNSIMLQEDPAYSGFNRPERIWNFNFQQDGSLSQATAVVELLTQQLTGAACNDALGTCWESSGIIDASEWLGAGTWLFDVQAHTLPFSYQDGASRVNVSREGGQLLYLRVPGS